MAISLLKLSASVLAAAFVSGQTLADETMIVWSHADKACKYNSYQPDYTLERVSTADPKIVNERIQSIKDAAQSKGFSVSARRVPKDSCVAVAYMDKKLGSCTWRTFTWRIASDADAAISQVQKTINNEPNLLGSAVVEVQCAGQPIKPKNTDTSFGVRG